MLEIKNLSFNYGKLKVFENFNLQVPEGQVCLITGVNGVGKSTLLRLISGVLKPARGKILFNERMGDDPRHKIGFISDLLSLYESLTVSQAIEFHKSVYKIPQVHDSLIRYTKIDKIQKIKHLSTGQRTIFLLSLILSIEPELLLIDEIIHSMDVYLRKVFLDQLILLLSKRKATVIMANLNFYDVEHIIDRVILLKEGRIVVDEEIDSLKAKVKKIISTKYPQCVNVVSQINYSDHTEFFVYPYKEEYQEQIDGEIEDLNLTDIISAFIGGEYAQERVN